MDLNLQPLSASCFVTGQPFAPGARVASYLVRNETSEEVVRYDVLESETGTFRAPGAIACRWTHPYKPRRAGESADRQLKLTAENLFVTLADPATELAPENVGLVQFLALMLERKRLLRPKGKSTDGTRTIFEHAKTKQLYEVPVGELSPEFFLSIQEQLTMLVGGGKAAEKTTSEGTPTVGVSAEGGKPKPA